MSFVAINPTDESLLWTAPLASDAEVDATLVRAVAARRGWRDRGFEGRAAVLRRAAEVLRERADGYARTMTLEMGKPLAESLGEVRKCAWVCEHYAEHGEAYLRAEAIASDATESGVRYDPLGTILAIMPWNFPLWQVFRFAAPALMAGNTALLKHAPNVPRSAAICEEVWREASGERGVFQNLYVGLEATAEVLRDPRVHGVALTGSDRAGAAVGAIAGGVIKPAVLELGGSDPFIVLDDADLDLAVKGAISGRYLNAGQSCIAAKRFMVHRRRYDAFIEALREEVAALVVGDPLEEGTLIGPIAREDLRTTLAAQVDASVAAGARAVTGGGAPRRKGWFYLPTILADVRPGMPVFDEETFGPALAVMPFDTVDEAVVLANQTPYGLGASVWTADPDRLGPERIDAGSVFYNGIVKSDPRLPFGGIKRSGIGRELGRHGIHAFVNAKTYWVR